MCIRDRLSSAVSAAMPASLLRPAGLNAMLGLTAGINAGRSGVISAMRSAARAAVNAAKSELQIHSPSKLSLIHIYGRRGDRRDRCQCYGHYDGRNHGSLYPSRL